MRTLVALSLVVATLAGMAAPMARAQSAPPTPDALWATYKQRFISSEGRLIDDSAGNVSHSEGQGYAMLLAAFAGDRETFDKLWSWTAANLEIRGGRPRRLALAPARPPERRRQEQCDRRRSAYRLGSRRGRSYLERPPL